MITQQQIKEFQFVKQQTIPSYKHFYGMDFLLKKIAGLPEWVKLDVHLDHGIIIRLDKPDQYLANTKADLIFVDNVIRKNMVPNKRNVFVLGPLFIRFRQKYNFKYNPLAKGTIVFPTHSSHHLHLDLEWRDYAKQLAGLPSEFQPITVCLYWIDVLKGEHRYFEEEGIDVICNGHMFDKNYANNFYSNLTKFKYASGNEPGSFLFYAVEMGMPFFMFGPNATFNNTGNDKTAPTQFQFNQIDFAKKLKQEFELRNIEQITSIEITEKQIELVKLVANSSDWINLFALRILLLKNALKTGFRSFKKMLRKRLDVINRN